MSSDARQRRAQIAALSFSEVLLLLAFLAVIVAAGAQRELARLVPDPEYLSSLKRELQASDAEVRRLDGLLQSAQADVRRLDAELKKAEQHLPELEKQLEAARVALLEANESRNRVTQLAAEIRAKDEQIMLYEKKYGKLGAGGRDKPNCSGAPPYLLAVDLLKNGSIAVHSDWPQTYGAEADRLPGIGALLQSGELEPARFKSGATDLIRWAEMQPVPCRFRVRLDHVQSSDVDTYRAQLELLERFFYVRR